MQGIEQPLYSFGLPGASTPEASLIQGSDGALYGTTEVGGTNDLGAVFKIGTNGLGYSVLYSFTGTNGDGANPRAALVQGSDGTLYGTTYGGGTNSAGTVFRIGTNGAGYSALYSFGTSGSDGKYPRAGLVQGSDGALYGATFYGGTNNAGTVFKIGTNGAGYSVLYTFTGAGGDGANPDADLVQGGNGTLYGTTFSGGTNSYGTVFEIGTNGGAAGYTVLYRFTDSGGDGGWPVGLIQGRDGVLYGTTYTGGTNGLGTIYKIETNSPGDTVLYSFTGAGGDGEYPEAALIQGRDGALYGTTQDGGTGYSGTVFKIGTNGVGYSALYGFTGTGADGSNPEGLIQGRDGALYGTTEYGGTNGSGTVFRFVASAPTFKPGQLLINKLPDGNVQVSFLPPLSVASGIFASSNLSNWILLTNLPATTNPVYYEDTASTNFPGRFYRAMWVVP